MATFDQFEMHLRDSLAHLYNPAYQFPDLLWQTIGCKPQQGAEAVQAVLIKAIENLQPAPDVPPNARSRRLHQLLHLRYIQELTQVETAQKLGITTRHLRREQRQAVQVLARRLWEQRPATETDSASLSEPDSLADMTDVDAGTEAWRSQIQQELLVLQQSSPGAVSDVAETIAGVVKLENKLASKHNLELVAGSIPSGLITAIHPSALRLVLMRAIEKLFDQMLGGEITLQAAPAKEGGKIQISVSGSPAVTEDPPHSHFVQEILKSQNGSVHVAVTDSQVTFQIIVPSAGKVTVLVVDDNADLVHFYRRYTAQTRYQIVHLTEGERLFETIADSRPDIIVLDIMLPDVDGWELLTTLYEHPATRSIPVIVCSVVKQQELASALGAAFYLPKPVRRRQFVSALDTVFNQVQSAR